MELLGERLREVGKGWVVQECGVEQCGAIVVSRFEGRGGGEKVKTSIVMLGSWSNCRNWEFGFSHFFDDDGHFYYKLSHYLCYICVFFLLSYIVELLLTLNAGPILCNPLAVNCI